MGIKKSQDHSARQETSRYFQNALAELHRTCTSYRVTTMFEFIVSKSSTHKSKSEIGNNQNAHTDSISKKIT